MKETSNSKPAYGYIAEFESAAAIYHAAEKVRDAGFKRWDVHSPYPIHGMDAAMGLKKSWLSALVLAFFSNLYACLTHYGDGAAPIFFGSGYIELKDWWRIGFLLSVVHLVVWLGVGLIWWKVIGVY